jgi:hypothetical protein
MIQGLPEVGKHTLARSLLPSRREDICLSRLDPRFHAERDPKGFLGALPRPAVIANAQYAPGILAHLSEEHCATHELGLGYRFCHAQASNTFTLHPLSVHELVRLFPKFDLKTLMFTGGWPALQADESKGGVVATLDRWIDQIALGGITSEHRIRKKQEFFRALKEIARQAGALSNKRQIAILSSVKAPIVNDWIQHLLDGRMLYEVPALLEVGQKRAVKAPIFYFSDCGIVSRLLGFQSYQELSQSTHQEALFRNLVFTEILRTKDHFNRKWKIHHWRTKQGESLDFIVQDEAGAFIAIQASAKPQVIHAPQFLKWMQPKQKILQISIQPSLEITGGDAVPLALSNLATELLGRLT